LQNDGGADRSNHDRNNSVKENGMGMETGKPGAQRAGNEESRQPGQEEADRDRPEENGDEALNDARALQQMIEGVPDSDAEFRRIEQKR
jgi:hypothetical protein